VNVKIFFDTGSYGIGNVENAVYAWLKRKMATRQGEQHPNGNVCRGQGPSLVSHDNDLVLRNLKLGHYPRSTKHGIRYQRRYDPNFLRKTSWGTHHRAD